MLSCHRILYSCLWLSISLPLSYAQNDSGLYSKQATQIWSQIAGSSNPIKIASPDGRSFVLVEYVEKDGDERVFLNVSGEIGSLKVDLGPGVGSELLWSPDSKNFFVTTSDQGLNGSYRLVVVGTFEGKLHSRDLTSFIYKIFGHPVQCGWPEVPNVGGITWIGDQNNILIAAEIVSHSNCDSFGTFQAYLVDPRTMKVIKNYTQLEAKRQFTAVLGTELKNAPDQCIRDPKVCYVSANHPSTHQSLK